MRGPKPILGSNILNMFRLVGSFAVNGAASPTAWLTGGKGMGVPARTSAGIFTITLLDPPNGALVGYDVGQRFDAIANGMNWYVATYTTNPYVITLNSATLAAPTVLADPPAAQAARIVQVEFVFGSTSNL